MPEVLETVLDNGLTVLIRESHAAPVVSCWAGYRVGGRNEYPGVTGISHWVEHMTFKGSPRLAKGDVFRLTARHGGTNNGFTSDDYTIYYETLPSAQLDTALLIESERMGAALFDPDETESERTVIIAERQGNENNSHFLLREAMSAATFTEHPYRWPVIGTREDLERMTRDELYGHYRSYYTPGNAVLAIAGDVEAERAFEQVREYFDPIPAGAIPNGAIPEEPPQTEERRVEVRRPGANAFMSLAYRTPAAQHGDSYALAMLDAVLSGGKGMGWGASGYMGRTARIYRQLVETRLAASAGSAFRYSVDPHTFSASLTLRPGGSPEAAEGALLETLEGVAGAPPTEVELARALRQTEAQLAYSREGVSSQAFALVYFQLLRHWSDRERHLERLRAVTAEDVARVAATYLRPENRTVGWFIPS
jgi:zinc protease